MSALDVPIEDPQFYLNDPWPTFAQMQREAPLWYYEPLDTFVLTRHADIRKVCGMPEVFVSSRGLFLNDLKYSAQAGGELMTDRFFPKDGEQVGTTDPPRHRELRRAIGPAFSDAALDRLTRPTEAYVGDLLDGVVSGETIDWIEFATLIPIFVSTQLIGLPQTDAVRVRFWSDALESLGGDLSYSEIEAASRDMQSLQEYIAEALEPRRREPQGTDLLSVLLEQELDDQKISEANVIMFAMTLMAGGSDTTRALLAGLVCELAQRPDQWRRLRDDRSLVKAAVEETTRWVTPARAFLRTASSDTQIGEQLILEGQHVYLMYMAANRDPEVFPHPQTYDIGRLESGRHVAFGGGAHTCVAQRLVRREAPIVLNALLDRFSAIELVEEPERTVHIIRNSWTRMPVVFHH